MFIISDAHIQAQSDKLQTFFEMLAFLAQSSEDIVFLGDVFDLWVALPAYEDAIHRRFLNWCDVERRRRTIGFVEGNHEYYLAARRKAYFSWCASSPYLSNPNKILFAHGDQVNRNDHRYLFFRRLAKNRVSAIIMQHLPLGTQLAQYLRRRLKHTNQAFRKHFPREQLCAFADAQFEQGVKTIFIGHFHRFYQYAPQADHRLFVLPAWLIDSQIIHFDPVRTHFRLYRWRNGSLFSG
jgi:UDP-2,3-diacylglucosamine pyrophosphatase LpxH